MSLPTSKRSGAVLTLRRIRRREKQVDQIKILSEHNFKINSRQRKQLSLLVMTAQVGGNRLHAYVKGTVSPSF